MLKIIAHHKVFFNFLSCKEPTSNFHVFSLASKQTRVSTSKGVLPAISKPTFSLLNRLFRTGTVSLSNAEAFGDEENKPISKVDPSKDRSKIIPPETSIRYLKSKAYKTTYGDEPVWVKYVRNFKGQFVPRKSRKTCIRGNVISTGSPCPICRDENLVLHYTNVDLLKQFIHPQTGEIYDTRKIHICQKRLLELEVAIRKARLHGLLTYEVPHRKYDYSEFYPNWKE